MGMTSADQEHNTIQYTFLLLICMPEMGLKDNLFKK